MRAMELDDVEPSLNRTLRGGGEPSDDPLDACLVQLLRGRVGRDERNGAGGDQVPRPSALGLVRGAARMEEGSECGCLTAGVCELDGDLLALGVGEFDDLSPGCALLVVPYAGAFWADASLREDTRCLDDGKTRAPSQDAAD